MCLQRISYLVNTIESVDEQIEQSLDILDLCYSSLRKASEVEILVDEPIVRQVVSDIQRSRAAVLMVANKLVLHADFSESESEDR